jgi:short subunit dehydrogenase
LGSKRQATYLLHQSTNMSHRLFRQNPLHPSLRFRQVHYRINVMLRLEGKSAIITGAGRGIGKAIVRKFIQEGARLLICDVAPGRAAAAAAELAPLGEVDALDGDVTDRLSSRIVRQTVSVTRWWAGRDHAALPEPTSSRANRLKTRRLPPVGCTLCWAATMAITPCLLKLLH